MWASQQPNAWNCSMHQITQWKWPDKSGCGICFQFFFYVLQNIFADFWLPILWHFSCLSIIFALNSDFCRYCCGCAFDHFLVVQGFLISLDSYTLNLKTKWFGCLSAWQYFCSHFSISYLLDVKSPTTFCHNISLLFFFICPLLFYYWFCFFPFHYLYLSILLAFALYHLAFFSVLASDAIKSEQRQKQQQ